MKVVLKPKDELVVELEDTDGRFEIKYDVEDSGKLEVTADMPDTSGREGVIYSEEFITAEGIIEVINSIVDTLQELPNVQPLEAPPRTFYKTTYVYEVLHEDPLSEEWDFADVLKECEHGSFSGSCRSQTTVEVGPQTMRKLLIEQGSDPEFFGIENGDEIDFKDVVIERDGVRVTWTWIGEGVDGEFDFAHIAEGDEPRLRVDVQVPEEDDVYSYCTLAPTWTSFEGLERMTNELVRHLLEDSQNPRHVVEKWTHSTRPDPAEMKVPDL